MNKGKFIILEGVDGVGKTTLAEKLGTTPNFIYVKRKQISNINEFVDNQMLKHNQLLWTKDGSLDHLLPTTYWITLQASWYILLTTFVIQPLLDDGKNVIVDGWYYKLKARVLLQNEDEDFIDNIFKPIKEPDYIFLLNADLYEIWNRKKDFRAYEFGKFKDNSIETKKDSFIKYQSDTYKNLEQMAKQNENWEILNLANLNIEESNRLLEKAILNRINKK